MEIRILVVVGMLYTTDEAGDDHAMPLYVSATGNEWYSSALHLSILVLVAWSKPDSGHVCTRCAATLLEYVP